MTDLTSSDEQIDDKEANREYKEGLAFMKKEEGWPQDYLQAFRSFLDAAYRGHRPSQVAISEMYMNGQGVPVSMMHAYAWAAVAATAHNQKEMKARTNEELTGIIPQAHKLHQKIRESFSNKTAHGASLTEGTKLAMKIHQRIHGWSRRTF